jgi:AbrB family looped-hinge helix DNA binding protein
MQVTVDRAGRIVIPKSLRAALGIGPNTPVELIPDGTGLRLEPVPGPERAIEEQDGLPLLRRVEGPVLTDSEVRRLRDESQR